MSYQSQWQLTHDDAFVSRCRACLTQQAETFKDDTRADIVAMAEAVLKQNPAAVFTSWQSSLGAAPGFADTADNGDGTVDSTKIADNEILANVQAMWSDLSSLYFASDGTPKGAS